MTESEVVGAKKKPTSGVVKRPRRIAVSVTVSAKEVAITPGRDMRMWCNIRGTCSPSVSAEGPRLRLRFVNKACYQKLSSAYPSIPSVPREPVTTLATPMTCVVTTISPRVIVSQKQSPISRYEADSGSIE